MSVLGKRIAAIEAKSAPDVMACHRIIAHSDKESQAKIAALVKAGAHPDDCFIVRMIVEPPHRAAA